VVPYALLNNQKPELDTFKTQSLYDFIEKNHNLYIFQGLAKIRPAIATKEIASKLQIRFKDLLLVITQADYTAEHRPVIYSVEYHLPDKFSFVINRKGPHR
jgi:DNA-binding GntR family transcriptional regulator